MRVTILGCGSSGGIPHIGFGWGECDPSHPYNRRLRSSILIQSDSHNLLIDTTPDLRQQLLSAKISHIDAVFYTHAHADHTHGIGELDTLAHWQKTVIPVYGDEATTRLLLHRFAYAFQGHGSLYPSFLSPHLIEEPIIDIMGIKVHVFPQKHGDTLTLGLRIGDFAYSTDVNELDEAAFDILSGVKIWVVDCLTRKSQRRTHSYLEKTLKWIDRVRPQQAYLTHMGGEMDYESLCAELPHHIRPAYDGLGLTCN